MSMEADLEGQLDKYSRDMYWVRDDKSVAEVTAERIKKYFSECDEGISPWVSTDYKLQQQSRGLWNLTLGRNPTYNLIVNRERNGLIAKKKKFSGRIIMISLECAFLGAEKVHVTFYDGYRINGGFFAESSLGSTRIATFAK
jgi:hypothetical protein